MNKIDKIIEYFRTIKEESPTMSSGKGGFSSSSSSSGPTSGFDPVMSFKRRKNGSVDGRGVSKNYKQWLKSLGMMS